MLWEVISPSGVAMLTTENKTEAEDRADLCPGATIRGTKTGG